VTWREVCDRHRWRERIGRGIVELFVEEGARVVIADVDRTAGRRWRSSSRRDVFQPTDVADADQIQARSTPRSVGRRARRDVQQRRYRWLVRVLLDDDFADFDRVMAVNILGVMVAPSGRPGTWPARWWCDPEHTRSAG